jgi:hypothetical protein
VKLGGEMKIKGRYQECGREGRRRKKEEHKSE